MFNRDPEIRLPFPEIVVHVNHRHAHLASALLQAPEVAGHLDRGFLHPPGLGKFEVVDYIDQEQRGLTFVGDAVMEAGIFGGHRVRCYFASEFRLDVGG